MSGLQDKVKIWIGTVHSEIKNISHELQGRPADFLLIDHGMQRYVSDLKLLKSHGVVSPDTVVAGDLEVYPGDAALPDTVRREILLYFEDRAFILSTIV